jgi:7-cyano-7-deazaguanine reductase
MSQVNHLTVLGNTVDGSLEASQLERFPAPNVTEVEFVTHEVTALCPVTNQPDVYTVKISYVPNEFCVESKTLKLYLMRFRNEGMFGEAITARLADDLFGAIAPKSLKVETTQQIRGGLQMTSRATRQATSSRQHVVRPNSGVATLS